MHELLRVGLTAASMWSRALRSDKSNFELMKLEHPTFSASWGLPARMSTCDLYFFSGTGYSKKAREYAHANQVALFIYDLLGHVQPVGSLAQDQLRRAGEVDAAPASEQKDAQPAPVASPTANNPEVEEIPTVVLFALGALALVAATAMVVAQAAKVERGQTDALGGVHAVGMTGFLLGWALFARVIGRMKTAGTTVRLGLLLAVGPVLLWFAIAVYAGLDPENTNLTVWRAVVTPSVMASLLGLHLVTRCLRGPRGSRSLGGSVQHQ